MDGVHKTGYLNHVTVDFVYIFSICFLKFYVGDKSCALMWYWKLMSTSGIVKVLTVSKALILY